MFGNCPKFRSIYMKVFIEQSGEENKKNIFNKETKEFVKTVDFHITYPYPYGYFLNTKAEDGDELDCYVITNRKLKTGSIIECNVIGMMEYFEDGVADHKILVSLEGENVEVDKVVKSRLLDFDKNYFIDKPEKKTQVGDFLGIDDALEEVRKSFIE